MRVLETVGGPADLKKLTDQQLDRSRRGDPRRAGRDGVPDRRPPGPEPGHGRDHPGDAPGVRLAAGPAGLRHRPPDVRAQAAHRPGAEVRHAPSAGRPVRLPEPGRVRARHRREQSRLDLAVVRRRPGQGVPVARRGPARGRADRRRRPDRRDGLGGAEQHRRRQGPQAGHHRQRQRPLVQPDRRRSGHAPDQPAHQPAVREDPRPDQEEPRRGRRTSARRCTRCCTG